jgi:hypothetical protein
MAAKSSTAPVGLAKDGAEIHPRGRLSMMSKGDVNVSLVGTVEIALPITVSGGRSYETDLANW